MSFSGGKDSTAMLLLMLEKKIRVDEIVFCDTGMEFPGMYDHIGRVEKYIGRKITHLKNEYSFEHYMFKRQKTRGVNMHTPGLGWPMPTMRWCTHRLKMEVLQRYFKGRKIREYVGIAIDEARRCKDKVYPLVEWKLREKDALAYCYEKGFDWGGLYRYSKRVSCWCCPLQNLNSLRSLRKWFPSLWQRLGAMDKRAKNRFKSNWTVEQLEQRFAAEDEYQRRQMKLFC